ncbi:hypothetical protein AgCh_015019 [Apium graveolens]
MVPLSKQWAYYQNLKKHQIWRMICRHPKGLTAEHSSFIPDLNEPAPMEKTKDYTIPSRTTGELLTMESASLHKSRTLNQGDIILNLD